MVATVLPSGPETAGWIRQRVWGVSRRSATTRGTTTKTS